MTDTITEKMKDAYWEEWRQTQDHWLALAEALKAQPKQEPVAWTTQAQLDGIKGTGNNAVMWGEPLPYHPDIPLYASPVIGAA